MSHRSPAASERFAERVRYERAGHIATITGDRREKLDVIDGATRRELDEASEHVRAGDEARVGIVTRGRAPRARRRGR